MKIRNQGFTLVEIMIVVLIIGLLAAIAIPNFLKARKTTQMNACIDNLRVLDGATEQWRMEGNSSDPTLTDLCGGNDKLIKGSAPVCPSQKTAVYTYVTDTGWKCNATGVDTKYPHVLGAVVTP